MRLGQSLKRRLTDYLDLVPQEETQESRALAQSIDALKTRLGTALAERRRLQSERDALGSAPADQAVRAEKAIGLGRDDLARAALRQRALNDARVEVLERHLAALATEAAQLEVLLAESGAVDRALTDKLAELDRLLDGDPAAAGKEP